MKPETQSKPHSGHKVAPKPAHSTAIKPSHFYRNRSYYRMLIPPMSTLLHVGCKDGSVLSIVQASFGVGVDANQHSATNTYPNYQFFTEISSVPPTLQFDYILVTNLLHTQDVHALLTALHSYCHSGTKIIIECHSYLWATAAQLARAVGLGQHTLHNRFTHAELMHFTYLAGFEPVTHHLYTPSMARIPLLSVFTQKILPSIPWVNRLSSHQTVVVRPRKAHTAALPRVSVIIPCKNEAGNIEQAVKECPTMGAGTEIIFIEGHSSDNTIAEIERVIAEYPEKKIRYYIQKNRGKADAVRLGFSQAEGEVLMILDGDLTVAPHTLPLFFTALVSGKGECINGSRLVYGMEKDAMMGSAWCANHFFARLLSFIIRQRISDSLCGTKVLWKKDYERIVANRTFFGLYDPFGDFDLLFGAARLNLKICDVPIHYKARTYGSSAISRFKDVWFLLWMSARAWWALRA